MIIKVHKNTIKKLIRLLDDALDPEVTDFDGSYNNICEVSEVLGKWLKQESEV